MGVRPPAETAGTGASASVPTSAPGPTLGASGQGTSNRAPTQGSPSLDAPIEEHATWLYHHQEQRAREHIPFENGMISLPAVKGHVLVRLLEYNSRRRYSSQRYCFYYYSIVDYPLRESTTALSALYFLIVLL